jgi:hypothetical protein
MTLPTTVVHQCQASTANSSTPSASIASASTESASTPTTSSASASTSRASTPSASTVSAYKGIVSLNTSFAVPHSFYVALGKKLTRLRLLN